jgi:hypothetical protein
MTPAIGYRRGHRARALTGTFGRTEIAAPIVRLIVDDTIVRVRLDKKSTFISFARRAGRQAGRRP